MTRLVLATRLVVVGWLAISVVLAPVADACCAVGRIGSPVVNADQTVILVWDAATKTQHFIRQATFRTADADLGFLIPSPEAPQLAESGDEAFPLLASFTAPQVQRVAAPAGGCSIGCSATRTHTLAGATDDAPRVQVLSEQRVAGFDAKVLAADSADDLAAWLKEHDYDYSDAVKAWAKPYVDQGWKFTALKVAKADSAEKPTGVAAGALRMSFQAERPLFPYREPESTTSAQALGVNDRLLRIFVLAEARYAGAFEQSDQAWTGETAHAGKLTPEQRATTLEKLGLPEGSGPQTMWLTEFEDHWPYATAPSDLWFSPAGEANPVKRPPIIEYVRSGSGDAATYFVAFALVGPLALRRRRSR